MCVPYHLALHLNSGHWVWGFWGVICTAPSTTGGESKQLWSCHLRSQWSHASSLWPVSRQIHHFCWAENKALDADQMQGPGIMLIRQREEVGPGWDLSSLMSPTGLKELKWFWATSAAKCKLHLGKLHFSGLRGYKTIPHIFLHSCLWLSSQHCPTDQKRIALGRFFSYLCINQFIDSRMPVPSI